MSRQRLYAMVGGAALAVVVLWYFLLWSPQTTKLSQARTRRDTAVQQTQQLQVQLQRLKASQQNEAAKLAELEKLTSAIPDRANLAQFILDTNSAAAQSGVTFLSIAPTQPAGAAAATGGAGAAGATAGAAAAKAAEIHLSLTVTGGYFQVLDFMNRLDKLPRLVVIDNLTVSPQGAAANGTGLQLSVAVTGRMFVNPSAVAGAPGTSTTTTTAAGTTTTAPGASTTTPAAGGSTTTASTR